MKQSKKHHPFHLRLSNEIYFITCKTHDGNPIFGQDSDKQLLLDVILKAKENLGFSLYAFVILNNHYHIMIDNMGNDISELVKMINGGSSFVINKKQREQGRTVWQNFWDWCVRDEKDFFHTSIIFMEIR